MVLYNKEIEILIYKIDKFWSFILNFYYFIYFKFLFYFGDNKNFLWYFFKNCVKYYLVWKVFIFVVVFLNGVDEGLMVFNIGFSFYKDKKRERFY